MTATEVSAETGMDLRYVAPGELVENPLNPRRQVGDVSLLAASMKQLGVIQPLAVFERSPRSDGTLGSELVLLAGHRRRAASLAAAIGQVPVVVRPEPDESEQLMVMVAENVQRNDLTPIEEAGAYDRLAVDGVQQKEIARRCGRSEAHVSKHLSIVRKLPAKVLDRFDAQELTAEAAYALSQIADDQQLVLKLAANRALDESFIVKAVGEELEKRKAEKARTKRRGELEAGGVDVVGLPQISNRSVAVLCGNAEFDWADLRDGTSGAVFIAIDVKDHGDESCHAALVVGDGATVWCCTAPGDHKDVASVIRFSTQPPPTVAELNEIVARNNELANRKPEPAPDDGRPSFADARASAAARLVHLATAAHDSDAAGKLIQTTLVEQALGGFQIERLHFAQSVLSPLLRRPDVDEITKEVIADTLRGMAPARAALLVAGASIELAIFPDDRFDDDDEGMWWDFDPVAASVARAYVDFLRVSGAEIGTVETFWLAACEEAEADGEA